jgi:hypothetical protein
MVPIKWTSCARSKAGIAGDGEKVEEQPLTAQALLPYLAAGIRRKRGGKVAAARFVER